GANKRPAVRRILGGGTLGGTGTAPLQYAADSDHRRCRLERCFEAAGDQWILRDVSRLAECGRSFRSGTAEYRTGRSIQADTGYAAGHSRLQRDWCEDASNRNRPRNGGGNV